MKNIPFVLPVKTALGHYIYEVNKNEILFVDENIFQCVTSELLNKSDEAVEEQLAEYSIIDQNSLVSCIIDNFLNLSYGVI